MKLEELEQEIDSVGGIVKGFSLNSRCLTVHIDVSDNRECILRFYSNNSYNPVQLCKLIVLLDLSTILAQDFWIVSEI